MKVKAILEPGDVGGTFILTGEDGESKTIEESKEFPALAQTFGWDKEER